MDYIQGVITLVIGLVVSIALHELGHLIPAKLFGVLTTQYMIGFGPTIVSRKFGETEVGLKAILLGGYVRMVGMYAPGHPNRRTRNRKGQLTLAEQARQDAAEEIPEGQSGRAFYAKPAWQRIIIMVSGTLVNLILALLCVTVALSGVGVTAATKTIQSVAQDSPAAQAGVMPGDTVVGWNGDAVEDWAQLQLLIAGSPAGRSSRITVQRQISSTVTPDLHSGDVAGIGNQSSQDSSAGLTRIVELEITPESREGRSVIGVMPASQRQQLSLGDTFSYIVNMGVQTAKILVALPLKLYETFVGLFEPEKPRDPNSVMGLVGMGQVAGRIASAEVAGYELTDKIVSFLMLFGSLNMTLFMFNLIPLMPLDGGQTVGALWEWLRDKWRRWRGKEILGPVDLARLLPLTAAVVFAFIAMTVLLIVADIVKPL